MIFPPLQHLAWTAVATLLFIPLASAQPFIVDFNVAEGTEDWNNPNNWSDLIVPEAIADEIARVASGGVAQVSGSVPDVVGLEINSGGVAILNGGSLDVVTGAGGTRGVTQVASAGSLSIASGGSLTSKVLALQGTFEVEQVDGGFQPVSVAETAAIEGTLELAFTSTPTLSAGDSWNLIDAQEILGDFGAIVSGYSEPYHGFATSVAAGGNGELLRLTYEQVLALSVDRSTGAVTLRNVTGGTPVETDGYSIRSATGALNPAALDSLGNQNVGGFVTAVPTNTKIVELQPSGSFVFSGGDSFDLGNVYSPQNATQFQVQENIQDLIFEHTRPDGVTFRGVVEYEGYGINDLVLQIDPNTGTGTLVNESPFTIAIDGYAISSESGQLLTNWDGIGSDWVKSTSSTAGSSH